MEGRGRRRDYERGLRRLRMERRMGAKSVDEEEGRGGEGRAGERG